MTFRILTHAPSQHACGHCKQRRQQATTPAAAPQAAQTEETRKQEEEKREQEEAERKREQEQREQEEAKRRQEEAERKREQEKREQERERRELEERRAHDAPQHARASFDSLATLGEAYHFVCGERSQQAGLAAHVAAFGALVDILKRESERGAGDVDEPAGSLRAAASLRSFADSSEQTAARLREALGASQREIRQVVALRAETLDQRRIESLDQLPEEVFDDVQQKMRNRSLMRGRHASELRVARRQLMTAAAECSRRALRMDSETAASLEGGAELQAVVLAGMRERENELQSALETARAGVEAYNTRRTRSGDDDDDDNGEEEEDDDDNDSGDDEDEDAEDAEAGGSVMGAHAGHPFENVLSACSSYDDWRRTYLGGKHAQRADAAMGALTAELAKSASVAAVLRLQSGAGTRGEDAACAIARSELQACFEAAGSAVAEERKHQLRDAMGFFPCAALLGAGRELMVAWQAQSAAVQRVVNVERMLQMELTENEECVDDSGRRSREKDAALESLRKARELHAQKSTALESLAPVLNMGNETVIRNVASALGLDGVPTLQGLRHDARVASDNAAAAVFNLTGSIQLCFPEVTLFLGPGLPPDLGMLWRPALSLETFDGKELVETESRHKVWRVWQGGDQFAIKEYNIGQADHLRTCLREAAIIYRQRHPAIVEVKALFQSTDAGSSAFYMQMPWYEHGSLGAWVHGNQAPAWSKVRSVLLDALLGVEHLHGNRIIHGDIKPANILVDGR